MFTTTSALPPQIVQHFSRILLSIPCPKFGNDEEDILNILLYVFNTMWKKLTKCPGKKLKCEKLYAEIMEIYERIKKKKENDEATPENVTERPLYYLECARRSGTEILRGLVYKARAFSDGWDDDEISEVQG